MTTTRTLLSALALSACASLPSPAEQAASQPAAPAAAPVAALEKAATPPVTGDQSVVVLYKGASTSAANRVDEDVAAAIRLVETRLNDRGIKDGLALKTVQPSADVQKLLDEGPKVLVTFSAEAGLSVILSATRSETVFATTDKTVTLAVSVSGDAYCGAEKIASSTQTGSFRTTEQHRLVGNRTAAERAAEKVAADLRRQIADRKEPCLGTLEKMIKEAQKVALPEPPPPPPPKPAPAAAPAAPAQGAAPAPSPEPPAAPVASGPLPKPARVWAVIAGISDFKPASQRVGQKINDLPGVRKDVTTLEKLLRERGVPASQMTVLVDSQATSGEFRDALRRVQQSAGPDDLLIVAISSHGSAANGLSGYGVPLFHDYDPRNKATTVDFWEIQSAMLNVKARQVVWLVDTCHSGGATVGLLGGSADATSRGAVVEVGKSGARGLTREKVAEAVFNPAPVSQVFAESRRHVAIMSAATPAQYAMEHGDSGGLFTQSLANAIRKAPADATVAQLFARVQSQVTEEARRMQADQSPVLGVSGRGGEIRF